MGCFKLCEKLFKAKKVKNVSIQLKTKEVNGKHVRKIKQINSNTSLYQNYKSTNKKKTFLSEEDEDFNFDSETHRELEI